ncbi:uncharacterized protein LOC135683786 [Rhopilema esculentum]|uniref:uncharacterized protein LOC135683786 n=1 Tax=Rhopilema esculentum TaxID=499914 RepID=UPI0031D161D5
MIDFDVRNNLDPESYANTSEARPKAECPVYPILANKEAVVVWDQERNDFGAVAVVRDHLSCLNCPNSTGCGHIRILKSLESSIFLPENASRLLKSLEDEYPTEEANNGKALSYQAIPFCYSPLNSLAGKEIMIMQRSQDKLILKPTLPTGIRCKSCGSYWSTEDPVKENWLFQSDVPVFMDIGIVSAEVYRVHCTNVACLWNFQYDGLEDGLLNMGTYMVSHKLLRRFMISFLHGRMPIYVFHTIYVREKRDEGLSCEISTFSYNKFKDAWYSYLELLDIDIDQGFGCEICKNAPDIVLMDATSLSFRKELTHWRSFLVEVEQTKEPVIPRYSYVEVVQIPYSNF